MKYPDLPGYFIKFLLRNFKKSNLQMSARKNKLIYGKIVSIYLARTFRNETGEQI